MPKAIARKCSITATFMAGVALASMLTLAARTAAASGSDDIYRNPVPAASVSGPAGDEAGRVAAFTGRGQVTRLLADRERYLVYALVNDPAGPDSLLVIDTFDDHVRTRMQVVDDPSDLAVGYLEGVLFVIGFAQNAIDVIDLLTVQRLETIEFPAPDNDPTGLGYHLASGRADRLYYTDAAATPAVHVLDRHTGADLGSFAFDGVGALAMGADRDRLYAGGCRGDRVMALDCSTDVLTVVQEADAAGSGDGTDTPLLLSGEGDLLAFGTDLYLTADLAVPAWTVPGGMLAMSRQAEAVFTADEAYDPRSGDLLHAFDFAATAIAVSGGQDKIYRYDAATGEITVTLMDGIADVPTPGLNPVPADGARVVLPQAQLAWETVPSALGYMVYLGTDPDAVASATTDSPEYLGEVIDNAIALDRTLDLDTEYYWRLDLVSLWGPFSAGVWSFRTAPIMVDPSPVVLTAPGGGAEPFSEPLAVFLANASVKWTCGEDIPWLEVTSMFCAPPPILLSLDVDPAGLPAGEHTGSLHFTYGSEAFDVPVQLTVAEGIVLVPRPADGATVMGPVDRLEWTAEPAGQGYRVYLGQDPDAVAAATTGSPEYLGETADTFLPTPGPLSLAAEYFWRVDALGAQGAVTGPVWSFRVAPVAMEPNPLLVTARAGESPAPVSVRMWSDLPLNGLRRWEDIPWLAVNEGFGQIPADELRITFHSEDLAVGIHSGTIGFLYGDYEFALQVELTVEDPMSATALDGFAAARDGAAVVLSWRALELDPGVAFTLQRQQDGGPLEPVAALVEQAGPEFRAVDAVAPEAGCSYWLQATLPGGARLTCGPARVQAVTLVAGLGRTHPNPFNPETNIEYALAAPGKVQVLVFDVSGRRVATLVDETLPAGAHTARWLGRDERGRPVNSGVYFVQLRSPEGVQTRKVMLVK